MNKYESFVVFKPELEDSTREMALEKFKGIIEENGEVESVDDWGSRRLAYEVKKFKEGHYYLITFKASPEIPKELERNYQIADDVIRYNLIRLDK